ARDELVLKTERRHVLDSLRIEDAVEVIALVLDDARVKAFDGTVDRSALLVEAAIAQSDIPRHETAHAGDAQAALPSLLTLGVEELDLRIDEHGQRYGLGVRIARVRRQLEHNDARRHADLVRR